MSDELVASLLARDKAALGRAVTLFEDPRAASGETRAELLAALPGGRTALVVGLTGAPGVGKSTLLAALGPLLVARGLAVAVLAVDPSSPTSGGALLGDRARTRFPPEERRLYFRSQASALELGGLAPSSFAVTRLLARLFDVVIVETVGVGQSEIEVAHLADVTIALVQPMAGDQLQFLKAGLMEVADWVVLCKGDLEGAARTRAQLAAALAVSRPRPPALHLASARTGLGMAELAEAIALAAGRPRRAPDAREPHFFTTWVASEYGRSGAAALAALGGAAAVLAMAGSFEAAQGRFAAAYRAQLGAPGPT